MGDRLKCNAILYIYVTLSSAGSNSPDSNEDVPQEILNCIKQLNVVSGHIYRSELEREKAILPILQTLLNLILEKVGISGLGVKSDGLAIV